MAASDRVEVLHRARLVPGPEVTAAESAVTARAALSVAFCACFSDVWRLALFGGSSVAPRTRRTR